MGAFKGGQSYLAMRSMTGIEKIFRNFSAFHFIKAGSNSILLACLLKVVVQKFEFPWVNAFDLFT